MKLNGKMLAAVAMMVGVLGAVGCAKPSDQGSDAVAPEETAAAAPTDETGGQGFEQDAVRVHYYAPHAPPAARFEERGRAPSARHFWAPGYYRWNGREHLWVGGRWEPRRDHYEYIGPRWENRRTRYEYIPGHWVRR